MDRVVKAAVTREKLVERFRRNSSVVQTAGRGEKELLRDTLNVFKDEDDLGKPLVHSKVDHPMNKATHGPKRWCLRNPIPCFYLTAWTTISHVLDHVLDHDRW